MSSTDVHIKQLVWILSKYRGKRSMLDQAIESGDLAMIEVLARDDARILARKLPYAVIHGHLPVVKYIRNHMSPPRMRYDMELRLATYCGHTEIRDYLARCGAAVSRAPLADESARLPFAADESARPPLTELIVGGYFDVAEVLFSSGEDIHHLNDLALRYAASKGDIRFVKFALRAGANVRAQDNEALQLAATYGHLAIVRLLIRNGADVNAQNDAALRGAARNGHLIVVEYLCRHGACADKCTSFDLEWMVEYCRIDTLRYVISKGAYRDMLR